MSGKLMLTMVVSIAIQFGLAIAGWVLAFRSGVGVERLLRSHFGAEYDAYATHTWRLAPGIY